MKTDEEQGEYKMDRRVKTTILIPNYKTPALTKLCLRLLRKHTDLTKAKIIVIDNNSQDESVDYLRSLKWIQLIERKPTPHETPPLSHARALDIALKAVETPYVLSIHTDTLVKNSQWLDFLVQQLEISPLIGGVGSWKLESKPPLVQALKSLERALQFVYYRCIRKNNHVLEGVGKNFYYLRSHCALYRMELIRKLHLTFSESLDGEHAGKHMHKQFIENGYQMLFLPSKVLLKYLDHINHATMVLNPDLGSRPRSIKKGLKRIEKQLSTFNAKTILADARLDQ